mgnify:CR=1 FL=1
MIRINLLKDAMDRKNVTIDDLAEKLGISKQSLYFRLNGKVLFKINEVRLIKNYLELESDIFNSIFFSE